MWNILLVEDNEKDRARLKEGLKDVARCVECGHGEEALQIFEDASKAGNHFDFILLDVTMPHLDGFEVLKTIRAYEEKNPPPSQKEARIIMTTSFRDSLMENYNMGWDDFLTKPIDIKILKERLEEMSSRTQKPA